MSSEYIYKAVRADELEESTQLGWEYVSCSSGPYVEYLLKRLRADCDLEKILINVEIRTSFEKLKVLYGQLSQENSALKTELENLKTL